MLAVDEHPRDLRRIAALFRPYRGRLAVVLALIALSAGLGMVSPFLLREVLDEAIPQRDTGLLTLLVAGMIGVSVATGVLGVGQTWLSNVVGQRVMHDLRAAVYRHLQRLSLAFFTRTRTGEVRSRMAGRWRMASVQMAFSIMPALVYWFAGQSIASGGEAISIGTVVAFTTLQTRLFFPLQSLLGVGLDVQSSLALFHRIFEYLDLEVDILDREDAVVLDPAAVRGDVRFEDVTFGYDADGPPTLDGIDLAVPAGARVAVVGETGSGKTTLGYLVARLYDTSAGRVTIDGVDVRDLSLTSLASTVGLVSQETYLFHATIRDNLRFAKPDASDEELEAAARAAQIHALIASLPDGYDTVVGERGYRFSGGEKQRIAIARTILRNPPVLVLDEATSALDTETERAVQAALDRTLEGEAGLNDPVAVLLVLGFINWVNEPDYGLGDMLVLFVQQISIGA